MKKTQISVALGLSLLLASCGGNKLPSAPTEADPPITTIRGSLSAGSGTGKVTAYGLNSTALAQASVAEDGSFTLTLPTAEQLAPHLLGADKALSALACDGTLTSSTAGVKGYAIAALQAERTGLKDTVLAANLKFKAIPPKGKLDAFAWLYTDQATRLTGDLNCTKLINSVLPFSLNVDVQTRAGWNVVALHAEGLTSLNGSAVAIGDLPTEWRTFEQLTPKLPF